MNNRFTVLVAAGLTFAAGITCAAEHAGDEGTTDPATPIELFACNYLEGKGPADVDAWAGAWNAWADEHDLTDYMAWTMVPYYFSPNQDFDFLWLGGSPSARALGRAQDMWLATGQEVAEELGGVSICNAHGNFAVLEFKDPPERENPENIVVSFSDCDMADGVTFDDIAPAFGEWAAYRSEHGSTAGMWVFFPAYGGGGEEFDFKFVTAHQNLEDQGADWDQYSESGWRKAAELFGEKLSCDSARVYLAKNVRMAESND